MLEIKEQNTAHGNLRHPKRNLWQAVKRGAFGKCPNCGKGRMFSGYLKVAESCPHCSEELHHQRADDAPPYFTIFVVGHIIVPLILMVELAYKPAIWIHLAMWFPLTIILSLLILPPIKGMLVAFQWALYMHGFDPDERDAPDPRMDEVRASQ